MGQVRRGGVARRRALSIVLGGMALAAAACSPHASKIAPSQWGLSTMFGPPAAFEFVKPAKDVRDAIGVVLERMELEVRWSNLTAVDGEYVFRSARQKKMKITYQALYSTTTRVEIYAATDETVLGDLVVRELERELEVGASRLEARLYRRLQPGLSFRRASLRSASTPL